MSERAGQGSQAVGRHVCAAHRVEVAGERALRKRFSLRSASSQVKLFARARIRARPPLFVFCLHSFTHPVYLVVLQLVKGEDFASSPFTFAPLASQRSRIGTIDREPR